MTFYVFFGARQAQIIAWELGEAISQVSVMIRVRAVYINQKL